MSANSTNYSFPKPLLTESANIQVVSDAIEAIDNTIKSVENKNLVQIASGTSNAITLNLGTLVNGYQVTFIALANNSSSATTINGKSVFKPSTTSSPTFIKDKGYKVYYNSNNDCFFCLASAEGTVLASQVLKDCTYSTEIDTGLKGNMTNRANTKFQICGYEGITECIPHPTDPNGQGLITGKNLYGNTGYIDGNSQIQMSVSGLVPANIRSGVKIGKTNGTGSEVITGTFTNDAVLYPEHLLVGDSGYDDGILKQGTMPNYNGTNQPASNYWQNGAGTLYFNPSNTGYYTGGGGSGIYASCGDFSPQNIVNGKNIFGILGNATIQSLGGAKYSVITVAPPYGQSVAVNLGWRPDILICKYESKGSGTTSHLSETIDIIADNGMSFSIGARTTGDGGFSPNDIRTSTGYTVSGMYYNSPTAWNCIAIKYS